LMTTRRGAACSESRDREASPIGGPDGRLRRRWG
jgi:hypothetical protein